MTGQNLWRRQAVGGLGERMGTVLLAADHTRERLAVAEGVRLRIVHVDVGACGGRQVQAIS